MPPETPPTQYRPATDEQLRALYLVDERERLLAAVPDPVAAYAAHWPGGSPEAQGRLAAFARSCLREDLVRYFMMTGERIPLYWLAA